MIYNPTSEPVEIDVLFIGIDEPVLVDPITVPARQVVVFDSGEQVDLPDGAHATVFATATSEPSIVVDRVITRTEGDEIGTGVLTGALAREGYVANTWYVPLGPDEAVEDALVLYNVDNERRLGVGLGGRSIGPGPDRVAAGHPVRAGETHRTRPHRPVGGRSATDRRGDDPGDGRALVPEWRRGSPHAVLGNSGRMISIPAGWTAWSA